jgi:hypothetical protein
MTRHASRRGLFFTNDSTNARLKYSIPPENLIISVSVFRVSDQLFYAVPTTDKLPLKNLLLSKNFFLLKMIFLMCDFLDLVCPGYFLQDEGTMPYR